MDPEVLTILGIAKQNRKINSLQKIFNILEDYSFHTLPELMEKTQLKYKAIYKYITELQNIEILEKENTANGIAIRLKKNYKQYLTKRLKERFSKILL
ncbi:MAG: hypothetical protein QW524_03875 [Candidatus Woesearchaeota archaeon]